MKGYRTIIAALAGLIAVVADWYGVSLDQQGLTEAVIKVIEIGAPLAAIFFRYTAEINLRTKMPLKR